MGGKKIVLGMSGGVDSSVAALLLKKKGYEVHGFFMNCEPFGGVVLPTLINWKNELKILKKICKKLKIELHILNCAPGYKDHIIEPMIKDYEKGLTPNPDTLCNKVGKFPRMFKLAKEIGAEFIATGHYARIKKTKTGFSLLRGRDKKKDQSYFLCSLNQTILSRTIFPLGELKKKEVRDIARKNNFQNWSKTGSRGICYLGKINLKSFLKENIPQKKGNLLSPEGEVIGTHPGAMFFTIGERVRDKEGFVISKKFRRKYAGKKLYIAKKTRENELVVAQEGNAILKTKKIAVVNFHLINPWEKLKSKLKGRIRHLGELHPGKLRKENSRYTFTFDKGVEGVAEGQHIALYDKEKLVASGEMRLR